MGKGYVNKGTLRTVYFVIFHSYINYVPITWGNNNYLQQRISLLQKKGLRIMHFVQFNSYTSPLFYNSNILKFVDVIYTENFVFIKFLIKIPLQSLLKIIIYALILILTIPDPPVKVSFLFQHTVQ